MIARNVQPATDIPHSFAKYGLAVLAQKPIEEDLSGVRMRRVIHEHGAAEPRCEIRAVIFQIRDHPKLQSALFKLVHNRAWSEVQWIFALRDPFDLAPLVAVDGTGLSVHFLIEVFC